MAVKQRLDTPTNNFATLNPLMLRGATLSEGNLKLSGGGDYTGSFANLLIPKTGKYYVEVRTNDTDDDHAVSLIPNNAELSMSTQVSANGIYVTSYGGGISVSTNNTNTSLGSVSETATTSGDVHGYLIDIGNGILGFYKNGVHKLTINNWSSLDLDYAFGYNVNTTWPACNKTFNFGQDPTFAGTETPTKVYTDARGLGRFLYQPPEGALALCTANIGGSLGYKSAPTSYVSDETNTKILTYNGNVEQVPYSPYATDGYSLHGIASTGFSFGSVSDFKYLHDGTVSYTISGWVYRTNSDSNHVIMDSATYTSSGTGITLVINTNLFDVFISKSAGSGNHAARLTTDYNVPLNQWVHFAFVFDKDASGTNKIKFYVNGSENTGATKTYAGGNSTGNSSSALHIGTRSAANLGLTGYIADLAIMKNINASNFVAQSSKITSSTHADIDFLLSVDSNGFKDSSSSPKTVTTVGTPSIEAWSPYTTDANEFGTEYRTPETAHEIGSFSFDGTGDYLTTTISGGTGSGDFTIELWAYTTNLHNYINWFGNTRGSTGFNIGTDANGAIVWYSNSARQIDYAAGLKNNAWYHIAFVRLNGVITLYLDGVSVATYSSSIDYSDSTFEISRGTVSGEEHEGYIADFRFVKGKAVYIGNFTPPSEKLGLTQSAGTNISEITSGETKLLLQPYKSYDADNLLTSNFSYNKDSSSAPKSLTYVGNAKVVDVSPYKSGANGSFSLNGSDQGVEYSNGVDISLDADFTIEMWVKHNDTSNGVYLGNNITGGIYFQYNGNKLQFGRSNSGYGFYTSAFTVVADRWYHMVVSRTGSTMKCFINGVEYSITESGSVNDTFLLNSSSANVRLGSNVSGGPGYHFGLITDFRVVKGQGLYAAAFTPPAFPLRTDKYSTDGSDPSGGSSITGTVSLFTQPGALASNDPAKKPFEHFKPVKYVGTEADGNTVTGVGFKSDLIWIKSRDETSQHVWIDSVRGHNKEIFSSLTNAETTDANRGGSYKSALSVINTDGFVLNSNVGPTGSTNVNNKEHIAWCWKAGGATPSKTYYVKSVGSKYRFIDDVTNSDNVELNIQRGGTYTFDLSDSSNGAHPFKFASSSSNPNSNIYETDVTYKINGSTVSGSDYVTNFNATSTTSRQIIISPSSSMSATSIYYYCTVHGYGMGGQINITTTHGQTEFGGSVIPIVSANKEAGFSIINLEVGACNDTAGATISHGLTKAPELIIWKNRSASTATPTPYDLNWVVWHKSVDEIGYLNGTNTFSGSGRLTTFFGSTTGNKPTNNVIYTGYANHEINDSAMSYIYYLFHSVPGYSAFGSVANLNNDEFVYLGFKPAWVMFKRTAATSNWTIYDNARNPHNVCDKLLNADTANNESTYASLDLLSNGFKARSFSGASGEWIYMAFAEAPVNFSNAR